MSTPGTTTVVVEDVRGIVPQMQPTPGHAGAKAVRRRQDRVRRDHAHPAAARRSRPSRKASTIRRERRELRRCRSAGRTPADPIGATGVEYATSGTGRCRMARRPQSSSCDRSMRCAQAGNIVRAVRRRVREMFRRPFQFREFIQQSWFIASVTILPTALVAIPFGAVIALQLGSLITQLGAQSFTGAASVLAIIQQAAPLVTALLIAGAGWLGDRARTSARARSARRSTPWRCSASSRSSGSSCRACSPHGAGRGAAQRPGQRGRRARRLLLQRHHAGRHARCVPGGLLRARPAARPVDQRDQGGRSSVSSPASSPAKGAEPGAAGPRASATR